MLLGHLFLILLLSVGCSYQIESNNTDVIHQTNYQILMFACGLNGLLNPYQSFTVRSRLHCFTKCSTDDECMSLAFKRTDKICMLFDEIVSNCSNSEDQHDTVFSAKRQDGEINDDKPIRYITTVSVDPGSVSGSVYDKECWELTTSLGTADPTFSPLLSDESLRCFVIQNDQRDTVFNQSISQFEWGFQSNFYGWRGLYYIHQLSYTQSLTLALVLELQHTGFVFLRNFRVEGRSTQYKMTFSSAYQGTNFDSMGLSLNFFDNLNGTQFSTYDWDNDGNSLVNCADVNHRGFWYSDQCVDCKQNYRSDQCFFTTADIAYAILFEDLT